MDFISRTFDFTKVHRTIVIGEIGVNHNGQEDLLFKLIDAGIEAGVDIIKLQKFNSEAEVSVWAPIAEYQKKSGIMESQLEMAKNLELPDTLLIKAFEYCKHKKVGFLCTAFDHDSVDFVADKLGCSTVKVPSPEISNRPLLEHMAKKFNSLLISTGASYLSECASALDWINNTNSRELALMHCVSEYPAPFSDINLNCINTLKNAFKLPVGFSDHTEGSLAAIVASTLGAAMLEKHYTLDKNLPGPDHAASADIAELTTLVKSLKDVSLSLGNGIKQPAQCEADNRNLIRKSLTCLLPELKAGTKIEANMLGIKRPLVPNAVEPFDIDKIIGRTLSKAKSFDEPICWSDFK